MLLIDTRRGQGQHRRPRRTPTLRVVLAVVDSGVRAGFAKLMEHNLPLAAASGLLVIGVVANVFSALLWGLIDNVRIIWVFSGIGIASWGLALGIFCIFPPTGAPRHAKGR